MNYLIEDESSILHAIQIGDSSDVIEHFGIKGMKWGFRKSRSRASMRQAKRVSKQTRQAWNKKYYNRHNMTESDLRAATNRLRMENDFAEQVKRANSMSATKKPSKHNGFLQDIAKTATEVAVKDGVRSGTKFVTSPQSISKSKELLKDIGKAAKATYDIWR